MDRIKQNGNGFLSESTFDAKRFCSPDPAYSPIYTWMWNCRITKEETDRRLQEMQRSGITRFYILPMPKSFRPTSFPTPLEPEYLTKEYFESYRYAIERAKALGMQAWLYDEGGWPSGGACGQMMLDDPSLVQERIVAEEKPLKKGEVYKTSEGVEIAFLGEREIDSGETLSEDGVIVEYKRVKTSFPHVASADYPDVTKAGATELFLKLTHEKYRDTLGDLPKAGVTALFTDEPTAPRPFPYTDEIKESFLAHFGEPIERFLPLLLGREKATEKTAKIKIAFYDMLSELFCERVLDREREWAHEAGLALVGHLDKDDEVNGSVTGGNFGLLRALRRFDVPGVDAIRRQIFPPKGKRGLYGENKFFPRYASSAAAQSGGRHALTESFAVYGAGVSYDEMRYALNFQAMRGINLFNLMVVPYGEKGYAQAGLLPHFTPELYPDLKVFNDYISRLSYLFSLGERVANVALYYPVEDGIAEGESVLTDYENAGKRLEERGIPFDVVDEEFLLAADLIALNEGRFTLGKANYETIVLPCCKYLSDRVIERLRAFVAAGGKVIATQKSLAEALGATYDPDLARILSPRPVDDADISYAESVTSTGKILFLMNEEGEKKTISLAAGERIPYLLRPENGEIVTPALTEGKITLELVSGELVALLLTDEKFDCKNTFCAKGSFPLSDWCYRPVEKLVIGESTMRLPLEEKEAPLSPESTPFAKDFSGSVLYDTTFLAPKGAKRLLLDLGDTKGAAEVTLNGVLLGVRLMPPYRYEIPATLLKNKNDLSVRITNGAAEEYLRTDAFDRYRPWQLGNYYKEESEFHHDSMGGGLSTKVIIFYE